MATGDPVGVEDSLASQGVEVQVDVQERPGVQLQSLKLGFRSYREPPTRLRSEPGGLEPQEVPEEQPESKGAPIRKEVLEDRLPLGAWRSLDWEPQE